MFYYILQFLYGGQWYLSMYSREEPYESEKENDRLWLAEAARLSARNYVLDKSGHNYIREAILFPVTLKTENNGEADIILSSKAVDALADIPIL